VATGVEIAVVTAVPIRVTGAAGGRDVAAVSVVVRGAEVVTADAVACPIQSIILPGLRAKRGTNRRQKAFQKPRPWKMRPRSLA
jgi:hypothetical protein